MAFLGAKLLTVVRREGQFVDGLWVVDFETKFTIRGSLQPMSGRTGDRQDQGEENQGTHKLYTSSELRTARNDSSVGHFEADRVKDERGTELKVLAVIDQSRHIRGVPHIKYLLGEPSENGR